ncbi:hypothetical protein U9M48_031139 [Paspalum notatum var. saurae]
MSPLKSRTVSSIEAVRTTQPLSDRMAPKRFFVLMILVFLVAAAETAVLDATTAKSSESTMASSAAGISEEKLWIAPRVPLFIPPRLPPNRMRARQQAATAP